jgi:hypothetical protein
MHNEFWSKWLLATCNWQPAIFQNEKYWAPSEKSFCDLSEVRSRNFGIENDSDRECTNPSGVEYYGKSSISIPKLRDVKPLVSKERAILSNLYFENSQLPTAGSQLQK